MRLNPNVLVFSAALVLVVTATAVHGTGGMPANKMAVSGSTYQISGPGTDVEILKGTMKTGNPSDAIITVSLECDILTNVTTVGDDNQRAFGQILVWVTLDDAPIPVAHDLNGNADDGKVVFCDRAHEQTTSFFDQNQDDEETISSFIQTRSANSFQWVVINVGQGTHDFVVHAKLTETATNSAVAQAVIGKRVLTVDPTKLAVDAQI